MKSSLRFTLLISIAFNFLLTACSDGFQSQESIPNLVQTRRLNSSADEVESNSNPPTQASDSNPPIHASDVNGALTSVTWDYFNEATSYFGGPIDIYTEYRNYRFESRTVTIGTVTLDLNSAILPQNTCMPISLHAVTLQPRYGSIVYLGNGKIKYASISQAEAAIPFGAPENYGYDQYSPNRQPRETTASESHVVQDSFDYLGSDCENRPVSGRVTIEVTYTYKRTLGYWDESPLVFDLIGKGISPIPLSQSSAWFDYDNDGVKDQVAWISNGNGFLALDRDKNGIIQNRSELFGNMRGFTNGFADLSAFDLNLDGVIDDRDPIFTILRIWQDQNGDGESQSNELSSLVDLGIASISLQSTASGDYLNGQFISHRSFFHWAGGRSGEIADVWLSYSKSPTLVSNSSR